MAAEGSTLKVDDLEEGKRYRISFDGEWTGYAVDTGKTGPSFAGAWFFDNTSSIEELPDPEPEWKHGAVVKVPSFFPYTRFYDKWLFGKLEPPRAGERVSKAFQAGTLEILYQPSE